MTLIIVERFMLRPPCWWLQPINPLWLTGVSTILDNWNFMKLFFSSSYLDQMLRRENGTIMLNPNFHMTIRTSLCKDQQGFGIGILGLGYTALIGHYIIPGSNPCISLPPLECDLSLSLPLFLSNTHMHMHTVYIHLLSYNEERKEPFVRNVCFKEIWPTVFTRSSG